jgi:CubicO group peptidase (beta-lactamase class C family)
MRTVAIGRRSAPVRSLDYRDPGFDLLRLHTDTVAGTAATIADTLAATHGDAFVVLHEGAVVCEWYADPRDETRPHALHSVTKSYVGALAGIMADEGALDVDTLAAAYVPELRVGGYAPARVRDLLDMRTGGDYVEDHDDPDGELAAMGEIVGWRDPTGRDLPRSVRAYAAEVPRVAQPGGAFSYRSTDTEVLAWVLEAVAGESVAELLAGRLLAPLGIEADGELIVDPAGDPVASGGLSLIPRDVARFGQMLLDGGSVGSTQVVPTMWVKDTRSGETDSSAAFLARVGERLGSHFGAPAIPSQGIYRNQFWVPVQGGRQLLCLGVHGQAVLIDSDNDVVAVKLSSWPTPQSPALFTDGLTCLAVAAEALGGRPNSAIQFLR